MKVKFCGITGSRTREAARLDGGRSGSTTGSRARAADPGTAVQISAEMRRAVEVVGVFVNLTLDELARAAEDESLAMLQLHGDEGPDFCREAARRTGCKVIKGWACAARPRCTRLRPPTTTSSTPTGRAPRAALGELRLGADRRAAFAGARDWPAMTPANVAEAISIARPDAVDVASGIEASPGVKDHELMAAFARNAQQAAGRRARWRDERGSPARPRPPGARRSASRSGSACMAAGSCPRS